MVIAVTFGHCRLDIILIDNVLVIFNILFLSRIKNYIQNIIRIGFRLSIVLNALCCTFFYLYIYVCGNSFLFLYARTSVLSIIGIYGVYKLCLLLWHFRLSPIYLLIALFPEELTFFMLIKDSV